MKASRIENSKKNIGFGLIGKVVQILFKFLLRTTIIYYFGAVYLGLDGLFLNIISVLSIAELGIGNAICFALYKPLAEGNHSKIYTYMLFYKKVYYLLGILILSLGLMVIPVLKYIVNFDYSVSVNYCAIYILFLFHAVSSYWFGAYLQVLYIADMKEYRVNNIKNIIFMAMVVMQIAVIIITHNYYLNLMVVIAGNISTNLWIAQSARKDYADILKLKTASMTSGDKQQLKRNIFALTVAKISTVIYTSSDNILISIFIGTLIVGHYSNYAYVVSAVSGLIAILFSGLLAGVGNANAIESPQKMDQIFQQMLLVNFWVYGLCFICLHQLLQEFIYLWAGENYLLSSGTVFIVLLLFLVPGLNHTCTIFKDACGLFWETRYRMAVTAAINIITSIILAYKLGLIGILLGTIISYFLSTFLYDPQIIYKKILKRNPAKFYWWYLSSFLKIMGADFLIYRVIRHIHASTWMLLVLKGVACFALVNFFFLVINRKKQEFLYFKELIFHEYARRKK